LKYAGKISEKPSTFRIWTASPSSLQRARCWYAGLLTICGVSSGSHEGSQRHRV
jgi:hypothetical protein